MKTATMPRVAFDAVALRDFTSGHWGVFGLYAQDGPAKVGDLVATNPAGPDVYAYAVSGPGTWGTPPTLARIREAMASVTARPGGRLYLVWSECWRSAPSDLVVLVGCRVIAEVVR